MSKVYSSKREEGVTGRIVEENKKYGTVVVEYLSGENIGKTTCISTSTLHRWWNVVGDIEDEIIESDLADTVEPEPEPELVTQVKATRKKKPKIDSVDRDSKVAYLELLAKQAGATTEQKKTDPYEIRIFKDGVRLGIICIKLKKYTLYTRRTLHFADVSGFSIDETNGGEVKVTSSTPEDSALEILFNTLFESEE